MDTGFFYQHIMKKGYFHQEGDEMEIRVTLNRDQTKLVKRIIEVSEIPDGHVADWFGQMLLSQIDSFKAGTDDNPPSLAMDSGRDYDGILALFDRFHSEGWIGDWTLRLYLRDLPQYIKDHREFRDTGDFNEFSRKALANA